jgi:two-component system, LytTR family, response regulator
MKSMEQKLDPGQFLRIHRSRIVRVELIQDALSIENRGLSDGSEHRSGRTYADRLENWVTSGKS